MIPTDSKVPGGSAWSSLVCRHHQARWTPSTERVTGPEAIEHGLELFVLFLPRISLSK